MVVKPVEVFTHCNLGNRLRADLARSLQGYPGTVHATITYILQPGGTLKAVFEATTDKTTPINMTQHSYFNLGGHASGDVLNHRVQIVA